MNAQLEEGWRPGKISQMISRVGRYLHVGMNPLVNIVNED